MEKYVVIAPVGENTNAIYLGIRDFPTKKIILLAQEDTIKSAESCKKDIEKFHITVKIIKIENTSLWEGMFEKVAEIKHLEGDKELLINTSSGDRSTQCALTSAAFVNGLKAFAVENNETMLLPILRFSYYKLLTDKKLSILKLLYHQRDCCASLQDLAKRARMSLPLISYHINGTPTSEGLKVLGLVEVENTSRKTSVKLATMGQMLIKGYVK